MIYMLLFLISVLFLLLIRFIYNQFTKQINEMENRIKNAESALFNISRKLWDIEDELILIKMLKKRVDTLEKLK